VAPFVYEHSDQENLSLLTSSIHVIRAPALDAIRHLSIAGYYFAAMARPDRWISWYPGAVLSGWIELKRRPAVILSTYPIATAHLIGWTLHRLTGLPWVADLRDPMAQEDYPTDQKVWRWFSRIEDLAARCASRLVFTAPSAVDYYRRRFPELSQEKLVLIENGYDESLFKELENTEHKQAGKGPLI